MSVWKWNEWEEKGSREKRREKAIRHLQHNFHKLETKDRVFAEDLVNFYLEMGFLSGKQWKYVYLMGKKVREDAS